MSRKGLSSQGYGFSSGHVWMWALNCEESWVLKNWCFWNAVLKTLDNPLNCKEIQPVHPKRDQSRVFLEGLMLKLKFQYLGPPDVTSWLIRKDPNAGKDWRQEEEGTTEDEMVGWPHRLNGHVFERTQSWWWKRRPGVLQFMGLQRIGHDWATELTWTGGESKVQCCKEQYCIGTWNVKPTNQGKLEEIEWEMTSVSVNTEILGISWLKWTTTCEFNSADHYIYYCGKAALSEMQ